MPKYAPIPVTVSAEAKGFDTPAFRRQVESDRWSEKQKPGPKALSGPLPIVPPQNPILCANSMFCTIFSLFS